MRHFLKTAFISTALLAGSSLSALAQTIIIKADKIVTNTDNLGSFDQVTLEVKDGRITQISTNANLTGDVLIEGDYWITPGIFAPISNLGLVEVGAERASNNTRASDSAATVSIRAADSFNPRSTSVPISRIGGVTYAAVATNSSTDLFGGIGMIASTDGSFSSVIDQDAFIYMSYQNGSARTGRNKAAAMAYLRAALSDAQNYNTRFKSPTDGDALRRADAKALRPVLAGRMPLLIEADRAVDIHNIVALKSAYPKLDLVIVGAAEGWMVAGELAKAGVAVMVDPIENLPYGFDSLGTRADNVKLLMDAGVTTAITNRSATGAGAQNLRLLTQHAGNAVANGLPWEDAFRAISLIPASLYGHPELGRIKAGTIANFVVWDGDPLEVTSAPIAVFINGKQQSLVSRQTLLRDRYNPATQDKSNYGYRP